LIETWTKAEWRAQRTRTPGDQHPGRDRAYDAQLSHGVTSTSAEEEAWELLRHLPGEAWAEAVVRQGHAWQQVPWEPAALEAAGVAAGPLRRFLHLESGVGWRP